MSNFTPIGVEAVVKGLDSFSRGMNQMQSGIDKSGASTGKWIDKVNNLAQSVTGFSLAQIGAGVVINKGIEFVRKAISETTEYANTVRKMSGALGIGTEETSRIIQVFDDYGLSAEQVKNSLAFMAKNGIAPSIENLAKLSDEILAMESPTERAEKLSKIFGRSWQEVSEVLLLGGDAIREQAGAISDSLILTEEQVKASREYEIATDNLSDAMTGLKVSIGTGLIPALTDLATWLSKTLEPSERTVINGTELLIRKTDEGTKIFERHGNTLEDVTDKYGALYKAQQDQIAYWTSSPEAIRQYDLEMMRAGLSTSDTAAATEDLTGAIQNINPEIDAATRYHNNLIGAFESEIKQTRLAAEANENWKKSLLQAGLDGTLQNAWDTYTKALDSANGEGAEAYEQFKKTTAEIIYQQLAIGLDADAALILAEKLGLVSEKDLEVMQAMRDLKEELDPAAPNEYAEAAAIFAQKLADGATAAEALWAALEKINGKTFTATVEIIENYTPGYDYGPKPKPGAPLPGKPGEPKIPSVPGKPPIIISGMQDAFASSITGLPLDELFDIGGALGGFGGAMASRYEKKVINPLEQKMKDIYGTLKDLNKEREELMAQEFYNMEDLLGIEGEIYRVEQMRNQTQEELAAAKQHVIDLEQKQADMAFLQEQMDFLDFLGQHGLNPEDILGGMKLGLGADLPSLIDAMTRAMGAVVEETEAGMFGAGGKYSMFGPGQNLLPPPPPPGNWVTPPGGGGASVQINYGTIVISNGMDWATFQAAVKTTVREAIEYG